MHKIKNVNKKFVKQIEVQPSKNQINIIKTI